MNNIQIFAIDTTNDSNWNLPYIRLGRYPFSPSTINDAIGENINQFECPLDGVNALWWLKHNLQVFGNPEYIGICHYRRFFGNIQQMLMRIPGKIFDQNILLTPLQQFSILKQQHLDGFITPTWYEDFYKNPSNPRFGIIQDYEYQWEGTYQQFLADNIGLSLDQIKFAYENMLNFSPIYLQPCIKNALKKKQIHFLGIFTIHCTLFDLFYDIVVKSLLDTIVKYGKNTLIKCNCRIGGYLVERLASVFFDALIEYGKKILPIPILEIQSDYKPIYRKQTTLDAGLKCNVDGLQSFIQLH